MRPSLIISVFSFIVSVSIALFYWVLRSGLEDNSFFIVIKVMGISSFILLIPIAFRRYSDWFSDGINKTFLNDSILPIWATLIIAFSGYLSAKLFINVSLIFTAVGYLFLAIALKEFVRGTGLWNKFLLLAIACFFGLWLGSVCWMWYLKPYMLEGWASGTDKIDTLFHVAIAQMIKTYGIPTTGLDGVPFMNYHWGSHWLFAQFSNFFKLPVVVVYQLCYPAIIAPLLFRTFLSFVIEVKQQFSVQEKEGQKLNFLFWIMFLAIFIGFFKSYFAGNSWAQYSSGGTGETVLMLVSESFAISLAVMFGILSIGFNYWHHKKGLTTLQQMVLLLLIIPGLLAILGFVKISSLFIVCCLIGYFFFRLRMFENKLANLSLAVMVLVTMVVFKIVFEPRENHGSFSLFYFYKFYDISLLYFITLFFIWNHLFIAFYTIKKKLYRMPIRDLISSGKLLPIEFALVVLIAGFLPTIFLRIQNYDALYFTEIHMWIAGALVLVYVPFYNNESMSRRKQIYIALPVAYLLCIFWFNTKAYTANVVYDSVAQHKHLLNEIGQNTNAMRVRDVVSNTYKIKDQIYNKNKVLAFLGKLKALDTLSLDEKRKTLIYVDFRTLFQRSDYNWRLFCHNIAFIVPALTGMAMIDGIDITYFELCPACCEQIGLGYHYFPKWKNREQIDKPFCIDDLCKRTKEKGFDKLIFYDLKTETFKKVTCTDGGRSLSFISYEEKDRKWPC